MSKGAILITGGAGYIGSHTVLTFQQAGHEIVVLDDLSTGRRSALPSSIPLIEGNAGDQKLVGSVIREHSVCAVVHFAGSIIAPESVSDPLKYYCNNTAVSRNLIQACVDNGVPNFIFSSTAAVYGVPDKVPVAETEPTNPINPYGSSKLMTEWILRDTAQAHDFSYVALRYFNVAGADPEGRVGQSTPNATHLLKVACQVALGRRPELEIYGDDYDTRDGTCIRDYIHVSDLAEAHLKTYEHLCAHRENLILNCGYGHGATVREIVEAVKRVSNVDIPVRIGPRRPGDSPIIVADNKLIQKTLGWKPQFDDTDFIVRTALDWEQRLSSAP